MSQRSAPLLWRPIAGLAILLVTIALFLVAVDRPEGNDDDVQSASGVTESVEGSETVSQTNTEDITADIAPRDISAVPILQNFALAPAPDPDIIKVQLPEHNFERYVVKRGDTPNRIALSYGIEASTILGGNPNLSQESAALQVDSELIILPVDGVLHDVKAGDSIESLAEFYQVPRENIIGYESNRLAFPFRLFENTQLLIPGAEPPIFLWTPPPLVVNPVNNQPIVYAQGTNTYVWPVQNRCISQFYWYGHPALDVAIPNGTPVYATDRGTVTWSNWAAGGYFDYGILVVVNHGNGHESFYAHLSDIAVSPGQTVEQGSLVGYSGNTGRSSGPHLHFELRLNDNRVSPFFTGYLEQVYRDCT